MSDYEYGTGTRVLITDGCAREGIKGGHGVIVEMEEVEGWPEMTIPVIQLDNGETVLGCECWWIPELVAAEIEARVALERAEQ